VCSQSPPVDAFVVEVMCTVKVVFASVVPTGTVSGPQVNTPCRLIEQAEVQPAPWPAIFQDRPGLVGSGSVRVTPFASPLPEFQTFIVKPMSSPAFTCVWSAVLWMWISGAPIATCSAPQPLTAPVLLLSPEKVAVQFQMPAVSARTDAFDVV